MSSAKRSSDIQEIHAQKAMAFGIPGVIALLLGGVGIYYGGAMIGLAVVLALAGIVGVIMAIVSMSKVKKVTSYDITCPICQARNGFTEKPMEDVRCTGCGRLVPIQDGRILKVFQVQCGFCQELNWYNERSVGLICENCDREIPISTADGGLGHAAMGAYAAHVDTEKYDLVLLGVQRSSEELIAALQKIMSLNRNQVKQMMEAAPVTMFTGIPKMKAEAIQGQLRGHHVTVEIRASQK